MDCESSKIAKLNTISTTKRHQAILRFIGFAKREAEAKAKVEIEVKTELETKAETKNLIGIANPAGLIN